MTLDILSLPFPSKDELEAIIEMRKKHVRDLSSYMWYILPVVKKFGEQVYEVAAQSLTESGLEVTAGQLQELAQEMQSPEKQLYYQQERLFHIGTNLTSVKGVSFDEL
jgi:hypothetical protein